MAQNAVPDCFKKIKLDRRCLADPLAILPEIQEEVLNAILNDTFADEKLHAVPPQCAIVTLGEHAQRFIIAAAVSQPKRAVVRRPVQVSQKF